MKISRDQTSYQTQQLINEDKALANYWSERDVNSLTDELLIFKQSPQKESRAAIFDDINRELNAIEQEILSSYKIRINQNQLKLGTDGNDVYALNEENFVSYVEDHLSPRLHFLFRRRQYLKAINEKILFEYNKHSIKIKTQADDENKEKNKNVIVSAFLSIFNIGKKAIDLIDDVWSAMRKFLSEELVDLLNPFLVSITGGIINTVEAGLGLKRAHKAYKDKNIGQRKTRIGTGIATFILGTLGAVTAGALIASALGISIVGSAFMPVVIPGFLLAIYNLSLYRKAYIFDRIKKQEEDAKKAYENVFDEYKEELNELNQAREYFKNERKKFYDEDSINRDSYFKLLKMQDECDLKYQELQLKIEPLRQVYQHFHEKRLDAERKVAMNTVEVFGSTLVLTGVILGSAAILGAGSVASFGILPLALIVTGVAIGVALKIFEKIDEKKDHKITDGIRNFFTHAWDKLFHQSAKNTVENTINPKTKSFNTGQMYNSMLQKKLAENKDKAGEVHDSSVGQTPVDFSPRQRKPGMWSTGPMQQNPNPTSTKTNSYVPTYN